MAAFVPYLIAFVTNACLMAVEIAAGRVLAPHLGVSVYSWTSVIGSVLLGMTAGNYAGGVLADQRRSRRFLGMNIAVAGYAALSIGYLVPIFGDAVSAWNAPLPMKTFLFSLFAFFPTAFLLSMVTPQLAKWRLQDLRTTGRVMGTLGAWGAVGSIAGTLLTGFVLLSLLGTKAFLSLVALALAAVGAWIARPLREWRTRLAGVISFPLFIGGFLLPGVCRMETNYYCIRVSEETTEAGKRFTLRLDHLVHSYVTPSAPERLGYGYEQVYANLVAMRQKPEDRFASFFIGGGGYAMPRYLETSYPSSEIVVAEIDPGVTDANYRFMELPTSSRILTRNEDARLALARMPEEGKFSFVFGDAFNDFSVPFHLTTLEFHQLLKRRMTADGIYALNIIDDAEYGHFFAAMVRTLRSVWAHVYVAPQSQEIEKGRNTIVLIATDAAVDSKAWHAARPAIGIVSAEDEEARQLAIRLIEPEKLEAFLDGHPGPILTDDFVPTDRYLAPVFTDAY